ncbi:hypothetical protein CO165_03705 [Candidatus Roizmanbacteria bacterium CG_4_9_14_3_um_filter_33_18]|uniref:Glycosyl transferase n=3 Tax=Candidatus Roizmaniibacteriota TaxID=1752723 RepID=A0A2M7U9D3_9BACT|nr:glycosyltransferase family 4 protein [bacterium]PIP63309.1 MAG: hypothetical protein COW97_03215 [Candidatus Roizmanbacteria bacterium CG22_combo_CG10-13_8_21_14_all_34_12]PIZ67779.1 MAG: hypothetical protein COY12_01225 [Candidatus Roizmanbacteria bacterium CG_4_10_14_0_2_um_filter_33_96]PJA55394.1 MAG: hypothetical protein CO165_03705 [Candidatus Roizmanbacteria bacterium CG_4_9_14_3_um_filter_33_18]
MRIAILASNFIRLPPEPKFVPFGFSGAPEKIMHTITEKLVEKGHDVYLFASGDSLTSAHLVSTTKTSTSLDPSIGIGPHIEFERLLISKCYQMAKENKFDIIHSIFDTRSAFYAPLVDIPTVSTLHSPMDKVKNQILSEIKKNLYLISISNSQRKLYPDLNYCATIYHGLDLKSDEFELGEGIGNYMIFVGRLVEDKGIETIISLSKKLQKQVYLLGTNVKNSNFWNNIIKPNIDDNFIHHFGYLDKGKLKIHYQNAKLFLFPIKWEEPFGLVMIESMACGTPVIAYARGSVPEIIKDGITGFIVNSSDSDIRGDFIIKKTGLNGLEEAIKKIYSMSEDEYKLMRRNCRIHVEKNFNVKRMVDDYEKLYQQIIKNK